MANAIRTAEKIMTRAARPVWKAIEKYNDFRPQEAFKPRWAPAPLLKRKERTKPPLGWPRETDSLCPRCVKEVREEIMAGKRELSTLLEGRPGEIKATILERDGQIWMVKDCPKHGHFEDLMAKDSQFLQRIESLFPGRDFVGEKTKLRNHGSSTIQYGRGSVLTVDLTNRCNMMCDPCFMDANQVGFVHELSWEEIKKILEDSITITPRRQMSVQFSGGEPTLSPYFLDALRYARKLGYFAVQSATNGIRFAQEPEFAFAAKEAGLRMAYLQFDGVTNEANSHRKVGNLFDVKLKAIEHLAAAGIDVILVTTLVNGVNNDQVGPILEFAIENADKVTVVSFQPVSFTGRDEDIDDETRERQRYTLAHLVHDVKDQLGVSEPLRDWFPLSALGPFSDMTDLLQGKDAEWGSMKCGCHPNCGVGTIFMVNKETKKMVPLTQFLDLEQLLLDIQAITDASRGKAATVAQLAVALLRNYKPEAAPPGFDVLTLVKQLLSQTGALKFGNESDAKDFEWRVLFVAGMWFQDLFNYDFRRTEMCIIPYGTQMGEISFCAFNTGVGWRNIIEKMKMNATVADWYREQGRHPVYAKNEALELPETPITSKLVRPKTRLQVVAEESPREAATHHR